jgi:hypothetical protein
MEFQGAGAPATRDGILAILDTLNVKLPQLLAVVTVETSGCGCLADRRPVILFERHIFSKQTEGKFDAEHPDISNRIPGGYSHGAAEYDRLAKAAQLDRTAAMKSASWGLGQVMGFNFDKAGYGSVETMVTKSMESEDEQLRAMANFLKATRPSSRRAGLDILRARVQRPRFRAQSLRCEASGGLSALSASTSAGSCSSYGTNAAFLRWI